MVCPKCGADIEEGVKVCDACGEEIIDKITENEEPQETFAGDTVDEAVVEPKQKKGFDLGTILFMAMELVAIGVIAYICMSKL